MLSFSQHCGDPGLGANGSDVGGRDGERCVWLFVLESGNLSFRLAFLQPASLEKVGFLKSRESASLNDRLGGGLRHSQLQSHDHHFQCSLPTPYKEHQWGSQHKVTIRSHYHCFLARPWSFCFLFRQRSTSEMMTQRVKGLVVI